jgi:hypothetical protein
MDRVSFTVTLTDEQKAALVVKAKIADVDPDGGVLPEEHGVKLSYVVTGNTVVFTVISKPWWMTASFIESQIHGFISSQS